MLDLARDTIFVTLAGSQAHGTAREGSDITKFLRLCAAANAYLRSERFGIEEFGS